MWSQPGVPLDLGKAAKVPGLLYPPAGVDGECRWVWGCKLPDRHGRLPAGSAVWMYRLQVSTGMHVGGKEGSHLLTQLSPQDHL